MTEVIITEKPNASLKIAEALSDYKIEKKVFKKVPYYNIKHNGKDITIVCAVGHIYNLQEKDKKGWKYPVFDLEWKPAFEIEKGSAYIKPYLDTIKKVTKGAKTFTVATDYDIEGEVIGLNVLRFACNQKDAHRMKYSTLTKEELRESYEHASKTLSWGQARAGETRHYLDFYYGINLTRALSLSIKAAGRGFKVLSIGRVQGPTLKIIVDRELEIKAFKPVPFWQLELITKQLNAFHKKDKFWKKEEADSILKKTKGKQAVVDEVKKTKQLQHPPHPFDLTTLQTEAYRCFGIQPNETLALAQELYTEGCISYPRTSSQQLPAVLGYKKILTALKKQNAYESLVEELLKKKTLKPNEGKKTDPAHPAIYPTGVMPKVADKALKIYDLVVRRFLATFGDKAERETMSVTIDVNGEKFVARGTITTKKGWYELYGKYVSVKDDKLSEVKEGDILDVQNIELYSKETQPPKRYTPASIIRELEKKNLGTKATRAAIVDALFDRGYLSEKSIEATVLGIKMIETLKKYCPEIIDEQLTRDFEEEMDKIREEKLEEETVLNRAKKLLTALLEKFKKNEKEIGMNLSEAERESRDIASKVGLCPNCKKNNLKIMYSRKNHSYFVGCSGYPDCKTIFSVPRGALIKHTDKICECGYPMLLVIRKGKRPYDYCINPDCPKKQEWMAKDNETMIA